jgi:hypothetical protein
MALGGEISDILSNDLYRTKCAVCPTVNIKENDEGHLSMLLQGIDIKNFFLYFSQSFKSDAIQEP